MTVPDGFTYIPDFLTPQEQEGLLRDVNALPFEHDRFRGQQLKRSYAQFGYAYAPPDASPSPRQNSPRSSPAS